MTDKMISTPYAVPCRCGTMLPKGAKARRGKDRLFYDCHLCRDRPPEAQGIFRDHNCAYCANGAKPCRQGSPSQCEYPHAKND